MKPVSFVILAAGKGVRMESSLPKPFQVVAGKTMLERVMDAAAYVNPEKLVVVVSNNEVEKKVIELGGEAVWQQQQLGTADALKVALSKCAAEGYVIVSCTDIPMVTGDIFKELAGRHLSEGSYITVLTAHAPDPFGYGRIIKDNNKVQKIVEEKEATYEEKKVDLINSGIYCITRENLENYLNKIEKSPVKGEYYLTDLIMIANNEGLKVGEFTCEYKYIRGVNTKGNLKEVEELWSK